MFFLNLLLLFLLLIFLYWAWTSASVAVLSMPRMEYGLRAETELILWLKKQSTMTRVIMVLIIMDRLIVINYKNHHEFKKSPISISSFTLLLEGASMFMPLWFIEGTNVLGIESSFCWSGIFKGGRIEFSFSYSPRSSWGNIYGSKTSSMLIYLFPSTMSKGISCFYSFFINISIFLSCSFARWSCSYWNIYS